MLLDRRTAIGGLGAAAVTAAAGAQIASNRGGRKLGYAIVGLGYYATRMIMPQFANTEHSRLTGLVSGTPAKLEKFGAEYKIPVRSRYSYADFDRSSRYSTNTSTPATARPVNAADASSR